METAEIVKIENTPSNLLAQAIEKGLGIEQLSKLMDLQERWEANQARKNFFEAFTMFQSNCPDLRKTKLVAFNQTSYKFTPLSEITRQIAPALEKAKLSFRWEIQDTEKELKVTFLVSHIDGHTEKTTMTANPDTSGNKNAIQARGSAITYLQRYTLIGGLGLSTADSDTDGKQPEDLDKLYKDFIEVYNQIIVLDETQTRLHPDNWRLEPTAKGYIKAIGEARKILFELQNKKK